MIGDGLWYTGKKDVRNMINALQSELTINVVASIIASLLFLALGFLWGKYKERRRKFGKNLDEYDFYPFTVTRENFGEFSLKDFRLGVHYFLKNEDHTAARQLIFIGEQNNVRSQLEPAEQKVYAQLFEKYDGKKITDDTNEFLENYVRIVRLIGSRFRTRELRFCSTISLIRRIHWSFWKTM